MVDIPLVPREQKEEVVKSIISFLIVQKEQENLLYFAMKGTYVGSAKFAYTTGREMLNAAAALRSKKSRQQLAKKLSKQMSLPFLSEDMGLGIVQAVVDALGDLVLSKVPARALEAAVSSGKEQEVQEFLTETLVGSDLQIPFMDTEQRRSLASQVVDAWLGSVDREEVKREQLEAEKAAAEQAEMRDNLLKQTSELASAAQKEAFDFLQDGATRRYMPAFEYQTRSEANSLMEAFGGGSGSGARGERLPTVSRAPSYGENCERSGYTQESATVVLLRVEVVSDKKAAAQGAALVQVHHAAEKSEKQVPKAPEHTEAAKPLPTVPAAHPSQAVQALPTVLLAKPSQAEEMAHSYGPHGCVKTFLAEKSRTCIVKTECSMWQGDDCLLLQLQHLLS
ncbi:unnamed protein product [Symbiodinium sp. CCMP2592]|nr:unnamed protein product [Symbiodinium sp. CCMP2592]